MKFNLIDQFETHLDDAIPPAYEALEVKLHLTHRTEPGGEVLTRTNYFLKTVVICGPSMKSDCLESIFYTFVMNNNRFHV